MFLKGFKRKSAQELIKKRLNTSRTIHNQQIKTVGVLVNATELYPFDLTSQLANLFSINNSAIKVLYYHPDKKQAEQLSQENIFVDKDLGFSGKINNGIVEDFINQPFDALVNFYTEDTLMLNLVSVQSQAKFKIGFVGVDEMLNDFAVKAKLTDKQIFISELEKYLPILNQI